MAKRKKNKLLEMYRAFGDRSEKKIQSTTPMAMSSLSRSTSLIFQELFRKRRGHTGGWNCIAFPSNVIPNYRGINGCWEELEEVKITIAAFELFIPLISVYG
ncbi:uncharacterized protein LOC130762206 [Actinidia eriantha]|uniref:uncharacterized protein LOC130762206 n=1 Tax=Actinidia eriantha TaxID=165200 RepID=UPI00258F1C9F|nr:uncharacterized protein LOC130762206 [Actinidia eriantha]